MRGARPTIHRVRSTIGRSGLPSPGAVLYASPYRARAPRRHLLPPGEGPRPKQTSNLTTRPEAAPYLNLRPAPRTQFGQMCLMRRGWSLTQAFRCERHPRLRELRWLRKIFLIAQLPLLAKEGNMPAPRTYGTMVGYGLQVGLILLTARRSGDRHRATVRWIERWRQTPGVARSHR